MKIDIDMEPLRQRSDGRNKAHWVLGNVDYGNGESGTLLYIKSSMTGDEPEDLRRYREQNRAFPHQSTADQFFNETQFEAYRMLGEHIASGAFALEDGIGAFRTLMT